MNKSLKYSGKLKSGKVVHGLLVIKKRRSLKKELESIGAILLKRYKRSELPMTDFTIENA